jgi:MYXO-CTERM domain-containing protein
MSAATRSLPALLALLVGSTALAAPPTMTRDQIIDMAKGGVGCPYVWGGTCWDPNNKSWKGPDCSGYVTKCWQIPGASKTTDCLPHYYTTASFYNDTTYWTHISRDDLLKGDALVYRTSSAGHIVLYVSGDKWGTAEVYEARGTAYGIVHRMKSVDSSYKARRRVNLITATPMAAVVTGQGSTAPADSSGKAYFRVCSGQPFRFWFEIKNTGTAAWVDLGASGNATGQRVRLGAVGGGTDLLTGRTRISLSENSNTNVRPASFSPPGGNCIDQPLCQRTRFNKAGILGKGPATPGIYKTRWRLIDEGRGWFGPEMWLSFNVVSCPKSDTGPPPPPPPPGRDGGSWTPGDLGGAGRLDAGTVPGNMPPQYEPEDPRNLQGSCQLGPGDAVPAWPPLALLLGALLGAARRRRRRR